MRPRVFPAEDTRPNLVNSQPAAASMRPRVFPAEDPCRLFKQVLLMQASMRPRVFPAEDAAVRPAVRVRPPGFNEAAGIPRGRPGTGPYSSGWVPLLQ